MEILLARGRGPIPWIIGKLTNSQFTHTGLRYSPPEEDWLVHASIGGVQPDWWFHFNGHYSYIKRYRCNIKVADKAADAIVSGLAHTGYDYLGLIWLGIKLGLLKLSHKLAITDPANTPHKNKCSEIIARWLNKCSELDPALGLSVFNPEIFTPEDLELLCSSHPGLFEEIKPC